MRLFFTINFRTQVGENLQLLIQEEGKEDRVYPLTYSDNGNWIGSFDNYAKNICYKYQVTDNEGNLLYEELVNHQLHFPHNIKEFKIFDTWNLKNYPENYLNNKVLQNKMHHFQPEKVSLLKKHTHLFRIEAPIYQPHWKLAILGNVESLGNWDYEKAVVMNQSDYGVWEAAVEIASEQFIQYKYGIFDEKTGKLLELENGDNRFALPNEMDEILHIKADHYFGYNGHDMYHAAGVAIPVFSLRSDEGFGVGEFNDIKALADWAKSAELSMIQILPINDTTVDYSWKDSYPYSAISIYALHPQYLSIEQLPYSLSENLEKDYQKNKKKLNACSSIDYENMIAGKWKYLKAIYTENKTSILKDKDFKKFLKENQSWLQPYAAFCVQRDKYKTADYETWKTHKRYIPGKLAPMFAAKHRDFDKVMLHSWVQFQLNSQMKEAVDYVHELGISIKGDLPIGVSRYSVETWTEPELFNTNFQTGAPPDQFTELGQNWGFPTYNWEAMKADGYQWWKNRFKALEQYFDAMRIDHILGFFRIWRIPTSATQGLLGYFYPALPSSVKELEGRHLAQNIDRYSLPFINEHILYENFGDQRGEIIETYLESNNDGTYRFKDEFNSQRKIHDYFVGKPQQEIGDKLINMSANVLLLEEEVDNEKFYHPRFNLHKTSSYQHLADWEKKQLYDLEMDYFYHKHEQFWADNAMEKLPMILNATNMLICGEDLGLIPDCVPEVMDRLAILALKVQRMPKENIPYTDPATVSYLNVVTTSSHDSSTLRQWWKEDRALTQQYFNEQLKQWGTAPTDLDAGLTEMILKQHLYNEAMLAIFPLQDFLATDDSLKRADYENERINIPAIYPHHWSYRMHLTLEELKKADSFNDKIANWVTTSNRN